MSKSAQQKIVEQARKQREEEKRLAALAEQEAAKEEVQAEESTETEEVKEQEVQAEESTEVKEQEVQTEVKEAPVEEVQTEESTEVKEAPVEEAPVTEPQQEEEVVIPTTQPTPAVEVEVVQEARLLAPTDFVLPADVSELMTQDLAVKLAIQPWLVFAKVTANEFVALHNSLQGAHNQLVKNVDSRDKVELVLKTIRTLVRHYNKVFGESSAFSNSRAFRFSGLTNRLTTAVVSAYLFLNNPVTPAIARANFSYDKYFAGVNGSLVSEFYRRLG